MTEYRLDPAEIDRAFARLCQGPLYEGDVRGCPVFRDDVTYFAVPIIDRLDQRGLASVTGPKGSRIVKLCPAVIPSIPASRRTDSGARAAATTPGGPRPHFAKRSAERGRN